MMHDNPSDPNCPNGRNRSGKSSIRLSPASRRAGKIRREETPKEAETAVLACQEADLQDKITVRALFSKLALRQMAAAEVGVRLVSLLRRCPGLMTEGVKGFSATSLGGEGSPSSRVSPDLLPLPVPRFQHLSEEDIERAFPAGQHDLRSHYRLGA